jgi:hypothetical protein
MVEGTTKHVLRVRAEHDPGILLRILERFCNLNIVPDRFSAVSGTGKDIFVEVEVTGVPAMTANLIVAKLGELPSVFDAVLVHTDGVTKV